MMKRLLQRVTQHVQQRARAYLILLVVIALLGFADWLTSPRPARTWRVPDHCRSQPSPDGRSVLTLHEQVRRSPTDPRSIENLFPVGPIEIRALDTGLKHRVLQREGRIGAVWSPDSRWVALTDERGGVALWNVERDTTTVLVPPVLAEQRSQTADNGWSRVAFSPDSQLLVCRPSKLERLEVWAVPGQELVGRLEGAGYPFEFAPDGKSLAAAGVRGGVTLWDLPGCTRRVPLSPGSPRLELLAFSPDGRTLAGMSLEQPTDYITLWDVGTETTRGSIPRQRYSHENPRQMRYLTFSRDSRLLVVPGRVEECSVWDVSKTPPVSVERASVRYDAPEPGSGIVKCRSGPDPVFSADGRWVALWEPEARTWSVREADTLNQVSLLAAPPSDRGCWSLLFSRDGTRAVVECDWLEQVPRKGAGLFAPTPTTSHIVQAVRLFSVPDGRLLGEVPGAFVAFVGDGNSVLTRVDHPEQMLTLRSGDATFYRWDLPLRRPYSLVLGVFATVLFVGGVVLRLWRQKAEDREKTGRGV
jgi:hypothetical protein